MADLVPATLLVAKSEIDLEITAGSNLVTEFPILLEDGSAFNVTGVALAAEIRARDGRLLGTLSASVVGTQDSGVGVVQMGQSETIALEGFREFFPARWSVKAQLPAIPPSVPSAAFLLAEGAVLLKSRVTESVA